MALGVLMLSGCGASNGADGVITMGTTSATATHAPSQLEVPGRFAAAVAERRRITINVHVPFEGAIPGTDLMVAYDRVRTDLAGLPANRSTPLAIYCRSGRMSAIAARELATLGYTDIVELDGGMDAWTASGRRLLSRAPA